MRGSGGIPNDSHSADGEMNSNALVHINRISANGTQNKKKSKKMAVQPCKREIQAAFSCFQISPPGQCGCFDNPSFATVYEADIRQSYLSTLAFTSPSSPDFCSTSNARICEFAETNPSCCCDIEMENYRKCLFETVLPPELPPPVSAESANCQYMCVAPAASNDGGNGGSANVATVVSVVVVVIAILVAFVVFFYLRRRRRQAAADSSNNMDDKEQEGEGKQAPSHEKKCWGGWFGGRNMGENDNEETSIDVEKGLTFSTSSEGDHSPEQETEQESESMYTENKTPSKAVDEELNYDKYDMNEEIPAREVRVHHQPSKASAYDNDEHDNDDDDDEDEDEDEIEPLSQKREKLRKKCELIESWNKERKAGSHRSLEDFLSSDDDLMGVVKNRKGHRSRDGETKEERRERREHRRLSRRLLKEKATEEEIVETSRDCSTESPKHRSSKRPVLEDDKIALENAISADREAALNRIAQLEEKHRKLLKKLEKKSHETNLEITSSDRRLDDYPNHNNHDDHAERKESKRLARKLEKKSHETNLERKSSDHRLDDYNNNDYDAERRESKRRAHEERKSNKLSSTHKLDSEEMQKVFKSSKI